MDRLRYYFFYALIMIIPPRLVGSDGVIGSLAGYVYSSFYVYGQALEHGRWW